MFAGLVVTTEMNLRNIGSFPNPFAGLVRSVFGGVHETGRCNRSCRSKSPQVKSLSRSDDEVQHHLKAIARHQKDIRMHLRALLGADDLDDDTVDDPALLEGNDQSRMTR